jgi:YD repeat-containing protein
MTYWEIIDNDSTLSRKRSVLTAKSQTHELEYTLSGLIIETRTSKRRTGVPTYRISPVVEHNLYIKTNI